MENSLENHKNREPVFVNNKQYFIDENLYEDLFEDIKNNYIPKQKIQDKIKILRQKDSEWADELSEPDSNFKNIDRNLKRIKNQIDVLEELLN